LLNPPPMRPALTSVATRSDWLATPACYSVDAHVRVEVERIPPTQEEFLMERAVGLFPRHDLHAEGKASYTKRADLRDLKGIVLTF
jgi:hypothetical protein